jgi:hypothetical protein
MYAHKIERDHDLLSCQSKSIKCKSHVSPPIKSAGISSRIIFEQFSLGGLRRGPASSRKPLPSTFRFELAATNQQQWPTAMANLPLHPFRPPLLTSLSVYVSCRYAYITSLRSSLSQSSSLLLSSEKKKQHLPFCLLSDPALSLACSIGISPKILVDQVIRLPCPGF